jgi:Spy/CpxP family protein refolding chaperone
VEVQDLLCFVARSRADGGARRIHRKESSMKTRFAFAAIAAACFSTFAIGQMGPGMPHGQGMGPGMMGDHGDGCEMSQGMPHGQGMKHGQGMQHGQGMGPGMMGGPGMASPFSPEALAALNLTEEQKTKVKGIHRDLQRKRHGLMGSLQDARWQAQDSAKSAEIDMAGARKNYDTMAAIHKQLFEAQLEAHKSIEGVLTKEQRDQLRKAPRHHGPGPR